MAQALNAQREPSMEEILASIRRIIEDGDTARPETAVSQPAPAMATNEPKSVLNEPAPRAAEPASLPRVTAPDLRPDLELRPAIQPSRPSVVQPASFDTVRTMPADTWRPEPVDALSAAGPVERPHKPEQPAPVAPKAEQRPAEEHCARPAEAAPLQAAPKLVQAEPAAAVVPQSVEAPAAEPAAPRVSPILSAQTGRQVAAAFGELTEAFEASRRRSFDDIAAEMMRPMLQDWLDNNLPRLVEKLVREEIERIARGAVE